MTESSEQPDNKAKKTEEEELPVPWKHIQAAVWLLGLAIIAWQDWWWPGILVVLAISGLVQGGLQLYVARKKEEKQLTHERSIWLPSLCPNCGGPISVSTVQWTGPETADCPYCKANIKRPT